MPTHSRLLLALALALTVTPLASAQRGPEDPRPVRKPARHHLAAEMVDALRKGRDARSASWPLAHRVAQADAVLRGRLRLTPDNRLDFQVDEVLKGEAWDLPLDLRGLDRRLTPGRQLLVLANRQLEADGPRLVAWSIGHPWTIDLERSSRHQAGLKANDKALATADEVLAGARRAARACRSVAAIEAAFEEPARSWALARLGTPEAVRALVAGDDKRSQRAARLASIGSAPALAALADLAERGQRAAVIQALGLRGWLADHDGAARLLESLGGPADKVAWHRRMGQLAPAAIAADNVLRVRQRHSGVPLSDAEKKQRAKAEKAARELARILGELERLKGRRIELR